MLELIPKLPQYQLARVFGWHVPLPINFTLGLTYRCNARCKTCRIYEHAPVEEMTPEEWQKVFASLGGTPYWATFTGGEPFLYGDLVEVFYSLCETCHPAMVNIPTNGLLPDRIADWVWQMAKISPKTKLIINVSLDHCRAERNDEIRGVEGYFAKATEVVRRLQELELPNLTVGIHTVISKYNVDDMREICDGLSALLVDKSHYITEIAERRVELGTLGLDIAPGRESYRRAVEHLEGRMNGRSVIGSFRRQYYDSVVRWLDGGSRHIPCYAGYASCQIAPDGEVWFCCLKAKGIGNLRGVEYDLGRLWNGLVARELRESCRDCSCPMANAGYTNMLLHPPTLAKVIRGLII